MVEPVSVETAQAHLRLDEGDPSFSRLGAAITAARQDVEQRLNGTIVNRPRMLRLDCLPDYGIELPNGPVISVTGIVYINSDGVIETVDGGDYHLVNYAMHDVLFPITWPWPTTYPTPGNVIITYEAGMMTSDPLMLEHENIVSAILLVLGDLWENREGQIIGTTTAVNATVDRLLQPYRRNMGM